jgi:hypothetical protein
MLRNQRTHDPHDVIRQLVSISTIEPLSPGDAALVSEHLASCDHCAEVAEEYKLISDYGRALPKLRAENGPAVEGWDSEGQKERLLARLHSHQEQRGAGSRQAILSIRTIRWSAIAALAIFASVFLGFRMGTRFAPTTQPSHVQLSAKASQETGNHTDTKTQDSLRLEISTGEERVAAAEKRIAELEAAVARAEAGHMALEARNKDLALQAVRGERELEVTAKQRGEIGATLSQKEKVLQSVQQELAEVREQRSRELLRVANADFRLQQISSELAEKDQTIARQQQLLEANRDVRELMGARQLHIADVLDIDKDGKNKKPFGRVFYTKGKSLIFYAFDLDQQQGIRDASVFQAWGHSDSNSKTPVSLGIFYLDSESNHRWVVKTESSDVLSRLDAVFVTAEKNAKSKQPTGKPFLYTYLRKSAPNHP